MALDLEAFTRLRPYVYHLTARINLHGLRRTNSIAPASTLLRQSGRTDMLRWRRAQFVTLHTGFEAVVLNDQRHLDEHEITLTSGWLLSDFIEYLNDHVYFWPGTAEGPVKSGLRMQPAFDDASTILLRISTAELLAENPAALPLFCLLNPGAPRERGARKVRRGPHLYMSAEEFPKREREVVELAFRSSLSMPMSTSVRAEGEWVPLIVHAP